MPGTTHTPLSVNILFPFDQGSVTFMSDYHGSPLPLIWAGIYNIKLQAVSGVIKLGRTENATHDPHYRETASEFSEMPIGELQQKAASGDPDAQTGLALCY